MLRLTLRSRRDGRLQARIVDRDGVLFVLDFGDPALLTDASRRVLHGGFTVSWQGVNETASAGNPSLFRQLALYYAAQGFLVQVDEPDWPRPAFVDPTDAPRRQTLQGPPTLLPDEPGTEPELTEILSARDVKRLLARIDIKRAPPPSGPPTLMPEILTLDEDFEDEVTEEISRKPRPR